jgi:hypothetical protein
LHRVCQRVVAKMDLSGGGFLIIDDTGFPKKVEHSVGVARQYCRVLGKQDNCQVAVSIPLATEQASLPVAYRLYLPKDRGTGHPAAPKGGDSGRGKHRRQDVDRLATTQDLVRRERPKLLRIGRHRLRGRPGASEPTYREELPVRRRVQVVVGGPATEL